MPAALSLGSALVRRQATSLPANIRPRRVAASRGISTPTRALLTSSPDLPSKPTWEAPELIKDIVITVQLPADTTRKDIDVKMFKAHSGRHASLAAKAEAGVKMETFLSSAKMSGAVYQKFYNVPVLKKQRTEKMTAVLAKSRLYSASSETRTAPNVD